LETLKQYWDGKNIRDIKHRAYTDEEEREAAINFLNNCGAAREEPFTVVVSKVKKKSMQKRVFRFITPIPGVGIQIEIVSICS
jgi:hypothetical protein